MLALAQFGPEVDDIEATLAAERAQVIAARAIALQQKLTLRRAKSAAVLEELLPPACDMPDGMSYHVISGGDVDFRSYFDHVLHTQPLTDMIVSTWCMAGEDVRALREHVEAGRVGRVDLCVGEIFPSQYPDEFIECERLAAAGLFTLKVARNHAKVMAGRHAPSNYCIVAESSANVNTNPRIEQTALHRSEDLFLFYREFFDGLVSIHRGKDRLAG